MTHNYQFSKLKTIKHRLKLNQTYIKLYHKLTGTTYFRNTALFASDKQIFTFL